MANYFRYSRVVSISDGGRMVRLAEKTEHLDAAAEQVRALLAREGQDRPVSRPELQAAIVRAIGPAAANDLGDQLLERLEKEDQ